jgi:hypothetical protein
MGCGCGGSSNVWEPAAPADASAAGSAEEGTPNERIQALHEAQARRVWPGTWDGNRQTENAPTP